MKKKEFKQLLYIIDTYVVNHLLKPSTRIKDVDALHDEILIQIQSYSEQFDYLLKKPASHLKSFKALANNSLDIVSSLDDLRDRLNVPGGAKLVYHAHLQLLTINILVNEYLPKKREQLIVTHFQKHHEEKFKQSLRWQAVKNFFQKIKNFFSNLFYSPKEIKENMRQSLSIGTPFIEPQKKESLAHIDANIGVFHHAKEHAVTDNKKEDIENAITFTHKN